MFGRILIAAAISGLLAGVAFTGLQAVKVLPLIWAAEAYEGAEAAPAPHAHPTAESPAAHAHGNEAWAPEDGGERIAFTLLANVLIGIGFALLLCAGFAFKGQIDWRNGVIWGLLGYVVFQLAPAFGLPPELPGMRAADVDARQIWWVATVAATAGGLSLVFLLSPAIWKAAGIALIALPHVVGAPHLPIEQAAALPAELAAAFVSASLVTNLIFWLLLGGLSAFAFARINARSAAA